MEFLNKWLKLNNMDGLVPTLELEDLYPEDGPLLKDHFLGVAPLSGDQPLCVVFVDPNTQNTTGELNGNQPTHGFYDEYTAPSWLENNVDLNDLDSSMVNSNTYAPASTAPFIEPPLSQSFPDPIGQPYDYSPKMAYPAPELKPMEIQPQMKKTMDKSEMEFSDYYYDASPESMAESHSSHASWSSTEEEYPSKEAILEEIHREAAEIERFSVSPPAYKVSKKSKNIKKTSKPRAVSIPKPYVERKKELNRQAATKYREKKRAEKENLSHEREILETRNTELKAEVSAMSSEIEYLKKLIKDIEARTKH